MTYIQVEIVEFGKKYMVEREDFFDSLESDLADLDHLDETLTIKITPVEMSTEEFEKLDEFEGF